MELNREQIIKALECCHHRILNTKLAEKVTESEMMAIINAISLIKELTEEKYDIECSYKALKRDNERLYATCTEFERNLHTVQADAVRKTQERLKQAICDNTYPDFDKNGKPVNIWNATTGYDAIDQVTKEMLEGV